MSVTSVVIAYWPNVLGERRGPRRPSQPMVRLSCLDDCRKLIECELLKFNLSAIDIDANQIPSIIIIENYPSEISRLSTLGCSERSIYSESVSE